MTHSLKVVIRVERNDNLSINAATGKRRMFDIVVRIPLNLLSVSPSCLRLAVELTTNVFSFLGAGGRNLCLSAYVLARTASGKLLGGAATPPQQ